MTTPSCQFEVSYEPSDYLRFVESQSAEAHLQASARLPVRFVALCASPIAYLTGVFGARHEFFVVSVDSNEENNFYKPGLFGGKPVEYNKAEFIIIELRPFAP